MPAVVVFLGPSLERDAAERILAADYRPPARRGDIPAAVSAGATIICLIDGVFFQESSVGHREIVTALREGACIIGASSMGALRAAELHTLGMEGVGTVFALYRDGVIESDDEVALSFDPDTFRALSEPLVNIRCTLAGAVECGALAGARRDAILSALKALYFPERTWEEVRATAERLLPPAECRAFLAFMDRGTRDVKREDALLALRRVHDILGGG